MVGWLGLAFTGSARAETTQWAAYWCVPLDTEAVSCVYPIARYEPGEIRIVVGGEVINPLHLDPQWWPFALDWYEIQLRGECVRPESSITFSATSDWGVAPRLDCPSGSNLVDNPDWFKVRVRTP